MREEIAQSSEWEAAAGCISSQSERIFFTMMLIQKTLTSQGKWRNHNMGGSTRASQVSSLLSVFENSLFILI